MYVLFVAILFSCAMSASFGLYLGQGGVVGSSNPRHRITPRTGPQRLSIYGVRRYLGRNNPRARPSGARTSGRIINYGVVSGGRYRPAQYAPGPGIVG